ERMDDAEVAQLRSMIERDGRRKVLSVDHPTDRLEDFFLRVVSKAQRDHLATSGAESGRGVTEFLSAGPPREEQMLDGLVRAGETLQASEPPAIETTPVSESPRAPLPDREHVEALLSTTPLEPEADAAGSDQPEAEAVPSQSEEPPSGPREVKLPSGADQDVIQRLLQERKDESD
ncbi:MAG: hypothetical protein V3T70_01510, partial [Phycisphaerae bacterium]